MRKRITWLVIADGARGRILGPTEESSGYRTLQSFESAEAHARAHDVGAAKPGRAHESAAAARHSIEPRKDPQVAAKNALAGEIASVLNEGAARGAFDELVVVALPRTAASLRAALDREAEQRITRHISKDLTKASDEAVVRHLEIEETGSAAV